MIVGVGIDLVEIRRIREVLERHGDRARRRLFTAAELDECGGRNDAYDCLAARLAAKEAAFKALGTGKGPGMCWTDVAVSRPDDGAPEIALSGRSADRAHELGVARTWVSLTHDAAIACAVVVLEASP